jgi:acetylserotonin O-methyltransferase
MEITNPAPVLDLINAFRRSKTMFTAVSMGIFDRLEESASDSTTLARELRAHQDALERLLDACVGMDLLEKQGANYSNSPLGKTFLTRSSPHTLTGYILYSDRALYALWGNLEAAVREGTHRWGQTFGGDVSLFENFFRTEEAQGDFLSGMNGVGMLSSPAVVAAFDLSCFRHIVDLGGGTGHLALTACQRYPELRGTVFDLPPVVFTARKYVERSPYRNRIAMIAGDFFSDPLPEADLYSLGRILHDWSPPKIRSLLAKICKSLPPGGALLVAEKLLNDDKSGPSSATMQSLNMLVCTEGKERSFSEYRLLLREAGFTKIEARVTTSPLDAILAVK